MSRLLVHVEGQTEETFVNKVLAPHLRGHSIFAAARLFGKARRRNNRGGIKGWPSASADILRHLKQDRNRISTTMADFYGLPQSGRNAWPGRKEASAKIFSEKAPIVEEALSIEIGNEMGVRFDQRRFIPFVMMHEFEALLFSDCERSSRGMGHPELVDDLQEIRNSFDSPEEINDTPDGAPSKRIEKLLPRYQKPLLGLQAVQEIGLPKIRKECPHFSNWLSRLENLAENLNAN